MRFYFNLPKRVTKIKIVLTEENDSGVVQEKEYNFKKMALLQFENDHQRSTFINSLIGPEWTNPEDVRKAKKEKKKKKAESGLKHYTGMTKIEEEQAKFAAEEGGNE